MRKTLIYERLEIDFPKVRFHYRYQGRSFSRLISLRNTPRERLEAVEPLVLHHLLAHVGMAFIPGFFALDTIEHVEVRTHHLPPESISFFQTYFKLGLAEFRSINQLPLNQEVTFESVGAPCFERALFTGQRQALLLNGGGKDSATAGELLKALDLPFFWLTSSQTPSQERVIALSGNPRAVYVGHRGNRKTIRRHRRYKGHTPFIPLLAFISVLMAYLYECQYIVLANEYSSNFGNFEQDGVEVNHQYGKSRAFETLFARYVQDHLLAGVTYFSVLSPLYEIQIAKLFSAYPAYFAHFRSCNIGHRQDVWCKACPKCAFIFLLLAAFLKKEQLVAIFGSNLFEAAPIRDALVPMLTGGPKPFECVGVREEFQLALYLALNQSEGAFANEPALRAAWTPYVQALDPAALTETYLTSFDRPHTIPDAFQTDLHAIFSNHLTATC